MENWLKLFQIIERKLVNGNLCCFVGCQKMKIDFNIHISVGKYWNMNSLDYIHSRHSYVMIFLGWLLKIFYWIERSAVSHEILKGFLAIRVFRDIWEMKLQVNIRKFSFNWRQSNTQKTPTQKNLHQKTFDSPLSSSSNRQLQSTQSITQNRKINPLKKIE